MAFQMNFQRKEIKFLLDQTQLDLLLRKIGPEIVPDRFPHSSISNLYYDTPDFRLIRRSLEKPDFKEKLRLRCYQTPKANSDAFPEIKRKVEGIVYKRRSCLPYRQAADALLRGDLPQDEQVFREIRWMYRLYPGLRPAMFLSYERDSWQGREDPELRLTFDRDILWRTESLDLSKGAWGQSLLRPDQILLEIKIPGAMPLWLARALSECGICRTSFSKYGRAYETMLRQTILQEGKKYA